MKQEVTRSHKGWALDNVITQNLITKFSRDDVDKPPPEGVYIYVIISLSTETWKLIFLPILTRDCFWRVPAWTGRLGSSSRVAPRQGRFQNRVLYLQPRKRQISKQGFVPATP